MKHDLSFEAFAMPRGRPEGAPAVHVTVMHGFAAHHLRMTLEEAESAYAKLGHAIGALRLGAAYSAGADPRAVERIKLAKRAIRIGWDEPGIIAVFGLTEVVLERLVAEVAGQ